MTKDEVLRGIGIFCTNAAYMGHKNGRWLLPTFSFLSHSCVCNSRFFISPHGGVVVRAQSLIKAGEEITISYFPTNRGNILRRQTIEDLWYFRCSCARCLDDTELGTFLSCVKCRKCQDGIFLPSSTSQESDWKCNACGLSISENTLIKLTRTLQEEAKVKEPDDIISMIEKLEAVLHPQHFLIMELKQKWVSKASETENSADRKTLERIIAFIADISKVNAVIDPGYTITLGQNLKYLNTAMLSLAKLKVASKEMSKQDFMKVAIKAASNIKIANHCFENTDFTNGII